MPRKVAKGTKTTSEYLIWDPECQEGGTLLAYCSGCQNSGSLFTTALLDGITRVPPAERFTVGRLLRDSVECPMPGPSHRKVIIEWRTAS
jgi:hypothetical protein